MKNLFAAYKTIHSLHIRSSAVLVYYFLCAQTNKENECWPSKNTIAKSCHISVSTVTRALRELETAGMLVTVYRFRKESNRQTSNIYKVYDTPQKFTQPPEDTMPDQEEQTMEKLDTKPEQIEPAACTVSDEAAPCIYNAPESPITEQTVNRSKTYQNTMQNTQDEPVRQKECIPIGLASRLFSSLRAIFVASPFQNDMLSRVTVTPQGTRSRTKVTDNLRAKSIFSKLAKSKKEQSRIFDAGFRNCPAQSE